MDISKIDWTNREQVLMAIKEMPTEIISNVSGDIENGTIEKIRADKEYMIEAVKQDGYLLAYASDELQNDKETVSTAITASENVDKAVKYIGEELLSNKEFVLEAIEVVDEITVKDVLLRADDGLKNDKDVALKAVSRNGHALKCVSGEMKKDKDVVVEAVKQNGFALEEATEEMKKDKDVVIEAVKQNGFALDVVSEEMKDDKDVVVEAIKNLPSGIQIKDIELNIGEKLRTDESFMKELEEVLVQKEKSEDIQEEMENDKNLVSDDISQHTPEEIAEGISPRESEVKEVAEEMIKEEIKAKEQVEKIQK